MMFSLVIGRVVQVWNAGVAPLFRISQTARFNLIVADNQSVEAAIVSVGGFLGIKEKYVAVPINALRPTERNGKWRLIMNATKEILKSAPGFKYDRSQEVWTAG
jgi:hypothetical protein